MRRILIVDDEHPVASGIAHIVKRDFAADFDIAGIACSGREAVEKVGQLSPDIILMDVRMPGFSGFDAIRELRKRGSTAAFIMITAYERFEIAREAIELGVVDYLLKPVSTQALAASLSIALSYLDRRDELEKCKQELNERSEQARIFAEKALLCGIMQGGNLVERDMAVYRATLGIQGDFMIAAALGCLKAPLDASLESKVSNRYEAVWNAIKYKTNFLMSPPASGLCMVLLPIRGLDIEAESGLAVDALEKTLSGLEGNAGERRTVLAGYGSARHYGDASISWNEAVAALYRRVSASRAPRVTPFSIEGAPHADAAALPALPLDDALLTALLEGSELEIKLILDGRFAESDPVVPPDSAEICSIISLIGAATRKLRRDGQIDAREERAMMAMEDLYAALDRASFGNAAKARILRLARQLREAAPRHSPAVAAAIASVRRSFAEPINLDRVADDIGISPGRLSRLFVEETGRGFSHYLIGFRIERAKEMLARPGASIKEVSVACGYPDQNYFARLFKKVTGLTPSTFFPENLEKHGETQS